MPRVPLIAIVDNDDALRESLDNLLRSVGWRTQGFASAEETWTRYRVGFVAGTTGAAYVQEHLLQAQHVPLGSVDEGLQALRAGEIDVFVHDAVTAWRVGDNEANDTLTSSFSPLTEEYLLAWAMQPTDGALHRDLEAVLDRWRHSGRLQKLFNKWLMFPLQPLSRGGASRQVHAPQSGWPVTGRVRG